MVQREQVAASVHVRIVVPSSKASRSSTLWLVTLSMLYGKRVCRGLELPCPIPGWWDAKDSCIICLASYSKLREYQWRKSWNWWAESGLVFRRKKKTLWWRLNLPSLKLELGSLVQTLKQRHNGGGLWTTENIRNCPTGLGSWKNELQLLSLPVLSAAAENLDQILFLARGKK